MALDAAGIALNDESLRSFARRGLEGVRVRQLSGRRNSSSILCHGEAGVVHIAARFFRRGNVPWTRNELFHAAQQLLERDDVAVPGFLEGELGIALAAASVLPAAELDWDAVLMLS
jgi:hypothetical protein